MLVLGRLEMERIDLIDDLTHVVTAVDLIAELREDLAYLVLQSVRRRGSIFEMLEGRKEFVVYEIHQIIAGHGIDYIYLAFVGLGSSPRAPPVKTGNEPLVFLSVRLCVHLTSGLQVVKIFKEEQPRGLFDIVQFITTTRFVAEDSINGIEGRFVFHILV